VGKEENKIRVEIDSGHRVALSFVPRWSPGHLTSIKARFVSAEKSGGPKRHVVRPRGSTAGEEKTIRTRTQEKKRNRRGGGWVVC